MQRTTQLLARYIGVALAMLLTKLGVDAAGGAHNGIELAASGLATIAMMILDHWLHAVREKLSHTDD